MKVPSVVPLVQPAVPYTKEPEKKPDDLNPLRPVPSLDSNLQTEALPFIPQSLNFNSIDQLSTSQLSINTVPVTPQISHSAQSPSIDTLLSLLTEQITLSRLPHLNFVFSQANLYHTLGGSPHLKH